ncbi:hypothetical protein L218DRAFT_946253 [Marasmius fiardii PR-910]|nr:hypothetical protein L218DRAFT_946253 [Marasmius fiardii PR-910]
MAELHRKPHSSAIKAKDRTRTTILLTLASLFDAFKLSATSSFLEPIYARENFKLNNRQLSFRPSKKKQLYVPKAPLKKECFLDVAVCQYDYEISSQKLEFGMWIDTVVQESDLYPLVNSTTILTPFDCVSTKLVVFQLFEYVLISQRKEVLWYLVQRSSRRWRRQMRQQSAKAHVRGYDE